MNLPFKTCIRNHGYTTFNVSFHPDGDTDAPWNNGGHGPVSSWTNRSKRPGEMVLCEDRGNFRYYDFRAAVKKARLEKWNASPYFFPTLGMQAHEAAMADFEYLRGFACGEWHYCGVVVSMADDPDIEASIWGVEYVNSRKGKEYVEHVISGLIEECLAQKEASTYPVTAMGV